jgi:cation diffusion facilitator family transporter
LKSEAQRITIVGGIFNIILSIVKLLAGIWGNSTAMIADAIHSLSDLITDAIAIIGIKISEKPADFNHNYGHGKFETIAAYFISMLVVFTGALLLINSSKIIWAFTYKGETLEVPSLIAAFAAFISIVVKELLYRLTVRVGRRSGSNAVMANAWHHRTDALSSVAALLGILAAHSLGDKYAVLDPIAALLVSILIIMAGIKLFVGNLRELAEASLDKNENEEIIRLVGAISGVSSPHNLKTRKIGDCISIELHIRVDSSLNITEGHKIATDVENVLYNRFGEKTFVNIHIEPL